MFKQPEQTSGSTSSVDHMPSQGSVGKGAPGGRTPDDHDPSSPSSPSSSKASDDPAQIAGEIFAALGSVPNASTMTTKVQIWASAKKPTHDWEWTLDFMKACKALSMNAKVHALIDKGDEASLTVVKNITDRLSGLLRSRQIIQTWEHARRDVNQRGDAWDGFVYSNSEISSDDKRSLYFDKVLCHDKGYAQILEAVGSAHLYTGDASTSADTPLPELVSQALLRESNTNAFTLMQKPSSTLREQLQHGFVQEQLQKYPHAAQEENMWGRVVDQIVNVQNPAAPDWTHFPQVIMDNRHVVFERVRAIVPGDQPLNDSAFIEALEMYGAENKTPATPAAHTAK